MEAPYDIYDYDVLDIEGKRLGKLTGFWVDDDSNEPEFASVKTGWLMGKNHVIPIRDAYFDHAGKALRVPYEERIIRDAPSFAPDQDIAPNEEPRIYEHYRLGTRRSTVGAGTRAAGAVGGQARTGVAREAEIPLREERVNVGKREVETGGVRLRKVVRNEVKEVPVELRRERVQIERIPANELRGTYTGRAFKGDEITMTERREEPVVDKTSEVVGGVRATKTVEKERQNVRADVRREDVEVDRDTNAKLGRGRLRED